MKKNIKYIKNIKNNKLKINITYYLNTHLLYLLNYANAIKSIYNLTNTHNFKIKFYT